MKTPRPTITAVIVGRNHRVYARLYKMEKPMFVFAEKCFQKEVRKAPEEGFRATSITHEMLNGITHKFTVHYEPIGGFYD